MWGRDQLRNHQNRVLTFVSKLAPFKPTRCTNSLVFRGALLVKADADRASGLSHGSCLSSAIQILPPDIRA